MHRQLPLVSLLLLCAACGEEAPSEAAPPVVETTAPALPSPSTAMPTTIAPSTYVEPSLPARVEPPPPVVASGRSLNRLLTARAVESREPSGPTDSFAVGERVYAFLELRNDPREAGTVTVSFEREGATRAQAPLTLEHGATPTFRTWAYHTPRQPGLYHAVVRAPSGEELGRVDFHVDTYDVARETGR